MQATLETSDAGLLSLLRRSGPLGIRDLADGLRVTRTAVRQRLTRLMRQGLVAREIQRGGRGRPSHRYALTDKARRQSGGNFADLALVLWEEIRAVKDTEVRRGLLQRIARHLADRYRDQIPEGQLPQRLEALQKLFADRNVELAVQGSGQPVLTVLDCPYPELAEQDRGICAVEKMLFTELLAEDVRLTQCRLDGGACCQFAGT